MRFLIDAQLPLGLGSWVADQGYPSSHVNDVDLGNASDDEIEDEARASDLVIWSKDSDFAERARRRPGIQVVWLRLGNTTNAALKARLAPHLAAIERALVDGESLIEIR